MSDEQIQKPDPLWYKDAVIYQLHVKAFFDGNNDGMGDFAGLTLKLDYLQQLGVNTLWLLPFYPSPMRDDGYDIADYRDVNLAYGNMDDFKDFIAQAHSRGMRVITELVINHTSDQHPWFKRAREAAVGSSERNFYVWNDDDKKWPETRIIFSDTEISNWAWDAVAKQYYWHRFFSHQPDLNFDNPEVLREVIEAMYFWLDLGVDGLRLDAVPYLVERDGTSNENNPETHAVIKKIRAALDERYPDRFLLAEANMWPEDVLPYFGDGDECHMAFHFPLMPRLYMALAQEDRHPITDIMAQTPDIPDNCQWATFLRNHDELTLEMVSDRERDYLWNFYAADKRARINFGIRRRLAPLMDNDRRKIELLNALLMSMPGTPVIYYGDELGMGDNIFLGDRNGVRTPMQWSPDRNGGFSQADPAQLYLPAIMDAVYGFQSINAESQKRVQSSLYNWMRNLITAVKSRQAFGRGSLRFLKPTNRKVIAYLREYNDEIILCVANLSRVSQPVELDLKEFNTRVPVEMLGQSPFPAIGQLPYFLTIQPYGFFWFSLNDKSENNNVLPSVELQTLVIPKGWESIVSGKAKMILEQQILPGFLLRQRWYKAHDQGAAKVEITDIFAVDDYRLMLLTITLPNDKTQTYFIACGISWESLTDDPLTHFGNQTISRIRQNNRVGILYEAFANEGLIRKLLEFFKDSANAPFKFTENESFDDSALATAEIKSMGAEQTNSSNLVGENLIFKIIRQPETGINPEEEISRFLTEVSPFERTPKLFGSVKIGKMTVGLLQQAVRNQGDGWKVTLDYLMRLVDQTKLQAEGELKDYSYQHLAEQLGKRTAEMHKALAAAGADFGAEEVSKKDRKLWLKDAENMFKRADAYANNKALSKQKKAIKSLLANLVNSSTSQKTRIHGDYHLGQVLVADNDFYIIDFEGEPARSLNERRRKNSPMKDVAGMIRSFDYARATVLKSANAAIPEEQVLLTAALDDWLAETAAAFLKGYGEIDQNLLKFFLIDKALYEIVYEASHRPDWLSIPVDGLLNILSEGQNG